MLRCITIKSASSTSTRTTSVVTAAAAAAAAAANFPSSSQGNSRDETPLTSPTVNLSREYKRAVQTESYNEIWTKIHIHDEEEDRENTHQVSQHQQPLLLSQVLQPNRECVDEALRQAKPNTLTHLVSSYFDHSENTTHLCLHLLHHSVDRARIIYTRIQDLIEILPLDCNSLTQSQCNWAFEIFHQFDSVENPFPSSEFHNFHDMRLCFSELKQQLDRRLGKSKSRIRLVRRANAGSALCFIGTAFGVAVSAVAIASHALVALVAAGPFLPALVCSHRPRVAKKELARMAQLDAADKGIYVLNNDLDTIDRLVARLYTAVEGDKHLIRIGLEGGRDKHSIFEVVKLLRKNHLNFLDQLKDLEEHICLCFVAVNRARSLLLQEILVHQSCNS